MHLLYHVPILHIEHIYGETFRQDALIFPIYNFWIRQNEKEEFITWMENGSSSSNLIVNSELVL